MEVPVFVENLSKVYHADREDLAVRAVDRIGFEVRRGESLAIIGPSGCGKSSLLNILGCLDRPTEGTYRLGGRNVAELDDDELAALRNRHIGFVFQSFNLLPRMTAVENVELPLLYGAVKDSHAKAAQALDRVGLSARARHLPSELSGGQRQRVAIARALVTNPSILLCDEPTGALDSRTGRDVLELLLSLNADGTTLLMVTHDLAVARSLARAIQMRDGHIVADGPASAVVASFHASEMETPHVTS
jgi:putative ABC transport system ATP-binding protein